MLREKKRKKEILVTNVSVSVFLNVSNGKHEFFFFLHTFPKGNDRSLSIRFHPHSFKYQEILTINFGLFFFLCRVFFFSTRVQLTLYFVC